MYKVFLKSPELDVYVKEIIFENPGATTKLIKHELVKKAHFEPRSKRKCYDDICYPPAISQITKKLEREGIIIIATRDLLTKEVPVYFPIVD